LHDSKRSFPPFPRSEAILAANSAGEMPTLLARRYTQVLDARLFGRDAKIQRPRMANCGTQQMPLNPRTGNYGLARA